MIVKDSGGKDFDPTPAGLHHAICYGLVDVGTHESEYMGTKYDRKIVYILWELPFETLEIDGVTKPRAISNMYTLSLSPKAILRKHLESWRGIPFTNSDLYNGFELKNILGKNCQLNVFHNTKGEKTYANISSVVPLSKGMEKLEPFNDILYFSFDEEMEVPKDIPNWLEKKIYASEEYNTTGQQNDWPDENPADFREGPPVDDSDMPF